ncbi:MAG: SH3 domain-containing protein [Anaerolineales bacterium]|nr:SH3 domain-containing protein [Anaerolineales bacterium]
MIFQRKQRKLFFLLSACLVMTTFYLATTSVRAEEQAQIPTVAIPTVTGTPVGAIALVLDSELGYANLRAGPSTYDYEIVGVLTEGSQVPAIGRSPGGQWIQVVYPGVVGGVAWINADLVEVRGTLPIVEPPPTPTPRVTATIDPTLAAQFLVDVPSTRLPTFTAPGPISIPTYTDEPTQAVAERVPTGLVIVILATLGIFGLFITLLRGR